MLNVGEAVNQINEILRPYDIRITDIRQGQYHLTNANLSNEVRLRIARIVTPIIFQREINDFDELERIKAENEEHKKQATIRKIDETIQQVDKEVLKRIAAAQALTAGGGFSIFIPILLFVTVPAGLAATTWCAADNEKRVNKWKWVRYYVQSENLSYDDAVTKAGVAPRDYPGFV